MQKIFVMGFIGRDPEERCTSGDKKVTTFPIGINHTKGGEKRTTWYRVNCWNPVAAAVIPFLKKGKVVTVIGELQHPTTYQSKTGDIKVSLTITCDSISFVPIPKTLEEKNEDPASFDFGGM